MLSVSNDKYSLNSVRWKPQKSNMIVTAASADGSLVSYSQTQNKVLYKTTPEPGTQLLSMDYNIDGRTLAMGTNNGTIIIWNDNLQKIEKILESGNWFSNGHSNRIFSVKFVGDDPNLLLSGGWDK